MPVIIMFFPVLALFMVAVLHFVASVVAYVFMIAVSIACVGEAVFSFHPILELYIKNVYKSYCMA